MSRSRRYSSILRSVGRVVTELYEAYPSSEDLAALLCASFIALSSLLSKRVSSDKPVDSRGPGFAQCPFIYKDCLNLTESKKVYAAIKASDVMMAVEG